MQKHARDRDLLLAINDLKQFIIDTLEKIGNGEILLLTYISFLRLVLLRNLSIMRSEFCFLSVTPTYLLVKPAS